MRRLKDRADSSFSSLVIQAESPEYVSFRSSRQTVLRMAPAVFPVRNDQSSIPARGTTPGWRLNRADINPAAHKHPCDYGVRVPHFPGRELISTPNRGRDLADEIEDTVRTGCVGCHSPGAVNGLADVRNAATVPTADLVSEDPKSACATIPDGAFGYNAAPLTVQVSDRRLLDDVCPVTDLDPEGGVIQIAGSAPLHTRGQRLVDAAVEPDEVAAGAQGQPVQIDGAGARQEVRLRGAQADPVAGRGYPAASSERPYCG